MLNYYDIKVHGIGRREVLRGANLSGLNELSLLHVHVLVYGVELE